MGMQLSAHSYAPRVVGPATGLAAETMTCTITVGKVIRPRVSPRLVD